jgi:hypothetical protein
MYRSIDSSRVRNLKLVAQLRVGDKLCTRYHHYSIDPYGPFSLRALTRLINGESRSETIESITQLIESCINQHGISSDEKRRLGNEFKEVIKGVSNLMVTYRGDKTSCVGIQLVKEMMEEYIELHADKTLQEDSDDETNSILTNPHPIIDEGITRTTEDIDLNEEEVDIPVEDQH